MCVYLYMCVCVRECACVCVWCECQRPVLGIFHHHPSSCFLRQCLSLYQELSDWLDWPVSEQAPGILLSLPWVENPGVHHCAWLSMWVPGALIRLHACVAATGPRPQHALLFLPNTRSAPVSPQLPYCINKKHLILVHTECLFL